MIKVAIEPVEIEAGRVSELKLLLTNSSSAVLSSIVLKVKLPGNVVLLQGSDRIEVERLAAGDTFTHSMHVKATATGAVVVGSSNFSYRDSHGKGCRVSDLRVPLDVVDQKRDIARVERKEANLQVRLGTSALILNEWGTLEGEVMNTGSALAEKVAISIRGPIACDPSRPWHSLGSLEPRERSEFEIPVRANDAGERVPLFMAVGYECGAQSRGTEKTFMVRVRRKADEDRDDHYQFAGATRILFLASDPTDAARLRLGKEIREIKEKLRLAKARDQFVLEQCMAVRPVDLSQAILDYRPRIVHFSGHGTDRGALCFEDEIGRTQEVSAEALAGLFRLAADEMECVLLNACFSETQAHAISQHIRFVIGMSEAISDGAAIAFAVGFYQALGSGRSIASAYEFGCAQIRLQGIPDVLIPVLLGS